MSMGRGIEIVGGGLAGLSLGVALARQGIAVTIYEASDYPRHRVCGEFITGLGADTQARLGLEEVLAAAKPQRGVAWFHGARPIREQTLPGPALALSRHYLDARLAAEFRLAGGNLNTRTRFPVSSDAPGRVFATGRRAGRPSWIGLKFHVRGFELARDLEVHLGEQAYVGISQVEDGTANVCGLFRRRPIARRGPALLLEYLSAAGLGALEGRIRKTTIEEHTFAAVAALGFDWRVRPAGRLELGDACAMIPPFTGNGMAMAFQSAEIALGPLRDFASGRADWGSTCSRIRIGLQERFRRRLVVAAALHPYLLRPRRQRWVAGLSRARILPFGALYTVLH